MCSHNPPTKPQVTVLLPAAQTSHFLYPVLTAKPHRSENIIAKSERVDTASHVLEKSQTVVRRSAQAGSALGAHVKSKITRELPLGHRALNGPAAGSFSTSSPRRERVGFCSCNVLPADRLKLIPKAWSSALTSRKSQTTGRNLLDPVDCYRTQPIAHFAHSGHQASHTGWRCTAIH